MKARNWRSNRCLWQLSTPSDSLSGIIRDADEFLQSEHGIEREKRIFGVKSWLFALNVKDIKPSKT